MTARRGPLRRDVDKAAARAQVDERGAAVLSLARQYATLIDNARYWADQARLAAEELGPADGPTERRLALVDKAVDNYRVTCTLGPKLLAALTALGLTAASGSTAALPEGGAHGEPDPARDTLAELRARRRRTG